MDKRHIILLTLLSGFTIGMNARTVETNTEKDSLNIGFHQ